MFDPAQFCGAELELECGSGSVMNAGDIIYQIIMTSQPAERFHGWSYQVIKSITQQWMSLPIIDQSDNPDLTALAPLRVGK